MPINKTIFRDVFLLIYFFIISQPKSVLAPVAKGHTLLRETTRLQMSKVKNRKAWRRRSKILNAQQRGIPLNPFHFPKHVRNIK